MEINISKKFQHFDDFLLNKMDENGIPGLATIVIKDGKIIFLSELGFRNVKTSLKVNKDTLFCIASNTKAFTSLAIALLVDEGKLNYDTPIKKYIPNFELKNLYVSEHLTLRDMLCHRSGLPSHNMLLLNNSSLNKKDLVTKMKYLDFSKDFRETFQYNNQMYIVLGYIIETVTGVPFEEFIKSRIFDPLDMNNSTFSLDDLKSSKNYSLPYEISDNKIHELQFSTPKVMSPTGGIYSNLTDMSKWIMFQLNNGKVNGKQLISEKTFQQMHSPQIPCRIFPFKFDEIKFSSYGLGWSIDSYRGKRQISHCGHVDGFASCTSFLPDENLGVIILNNLDQSMLPLSLSYIIYDKFFGYEYVDWIEKINNEINQMLESYKNYYSAKQKTENKNSKPSHPIHNYEGIFNNPAYGIIKIKKEENTLKLVYNSNEYPLEHKAYDVFSINITEFIINANFHCDDDGNICSVSIPFEESVKPIIFKKVS